MATEAHILSDGELQSPIQDPQKRSIGIVVAEWNSTITKALLDGAVETLKAHDVKKIQVMQVPGTFELTHAAAVLQDSSMRHDAIIVLGCVVRGDTPHFDYVCQSVTQGITQLNLREEAESEAIRRAPVIFGVLTTDNMQQALDRAGGRLGNKGSEAAEAALKMCAPYTYVVK